MRALTTPVLAAAAVALLSCAPGRAAAPSPPRVDTSKGEVIIASNLPTSGSQGLSGLPAQNGVEFAVNQKKAIRGYKLTFVGYDDAIDGTSNPDQGAKNLKSMLDDPKVLGAVGPLQSAVARAEIPVANAAELAMISPSNTGECLTQPYPYCNPQPAALRPSGKPNNYFRIAAPDPVQGTAMADFTVDTLGKTKVAVFTDGQIFGLGVAETFVKELQKKGGTQVARQNFDMTSINDFTPFLNEARANGAQAIYAGSTSKNRACIVRNQARGIIDVPFLGPDGIVDGQCLQNAGSSADGMYGTIATTDVTQSTDPAVRSLVSTFQKTPWGSNRTPKREDLGFYTFSAYDCAAILIDAIGRAIEANGGAMPTRAQVRDQVAKTKDLKLTTGTYSFDERGDATTPTISVYQSRGGDWVFNKQFSVRV